LQFLSERELLLADEKSYHRWDFMVGRETSTTPKGLVGLAVSAGGRLAVLDGHSADQPRDAVVVWDLIEGKQAAVLPHVTFVPASVSFSRDEKQLALVDFSEKRMTILVWDLGTQSLISRLSSRALQASPGFVDQALTWGFPASSFSPDGTLLAARAFRGGRPVLCLWDVETGTELKALPDTLYSWWGEDGRILVTLGGKTGEEDPFWGIILPNWYRGEKTLPGGHINLWGVMHPTPTYLLPANIQAASFAADGSRLAVNDLIWEVKKNAENYSLRRSAIPTAGMPLLFRGGDAVWAYARSRDGAYATLRQVAPEKREFVLPRPVYPEIDKKLAEGLIRPGDRGDFHAVLLALDPDGNRALIASTADFFPKEGGFGIYASPLELWDLPVGKRLAFWNRDSYVVDHNEKTAGQVEEWKCFQFSPDGKRVATGSTTGMKIWNVATGKVELSLAGGLVIDQLAFSRDGKRVLAVSSQHQGGSYTEAGGRITEDTRTLGRAAVFAAETGEELRFWEAPRQERDWQSSALSPDGAWVASGRGNGQVALWDVATGRELARWEAHEAGVTALVFHPDGKILVSGSKDGVLKLWNLPFIRKELAALGLDW
jgi:WD40 repeat protein